MRYCDENAYKNASTWGQLGLVAALAVGLGFSLSSSPAIGYPAGAAVSMGSNPLWSTGGELSYDEVVTLVTAPAEHDAVITDIALYCNGSAHSWLRLSDGTVVGRYRVTDGSGNVNRSLQSGISVPAGLSVELHHTSGSTTFYNVSGYYAQP